MHIHICEKIPIHERRGMFEGKQGEVYRELGRKEKGKTLSIFLKDHLKMQNTFSYYKRIHMSS